MDCWTGRKIISLIASQVLILLIFTPARADIGMGVGIGYSSIRVLDPGFDYISGNNYLEELNIEASYRVHGDFSAILDYMYSYQKAEETIKSFLITHGAILGVRYTLSYIKWIQPYTDAGIVYYWGRLALSDKYSELIERDWTLGISGEIGLLLLPSQKYNLFLKASAGYILNPHFDNLPLNFGRFGVLELEGRRYTITGGILF